ncbi:MAG: Ig-like domain-containing protein [Dehalococcoidia bacterium]|nr:Ig-like domain-containing protein [Dehalococcoidia bacterium]
MTSSTSSNPFDLYYAEILRNEGLNAFAVADIAAVNAGLLASYDVVLLAEMPLSSAQASVFSTWVNGGGNLIAFRPDSDLASLLGITSAGGTLTNGYLRVTTSAAPGAGIVSETIQFKGVADRYSLSGATTVATVYNNATTASSNPAVTLRSVGSNGGQAAAFTYDLARSVVLQRQGNPDWVGQERDGQPPLRSDDLFFGPAAGDSQPNWVDLDKVAIPQADEQQRLLVNVISEVSKDRRPLPRFWYLPRGLKAAVVMTGDDHGHGGTAGRFNQFLALSAPGCSVANWECVRGTSYIYPYTPISNATAVAFQNQGFEVALHADTGCANYTQAQLESVFDDQLASFATLYPGLATPITSRTHCIAWSGWTIQPTVELSEGIRFDTNYYYWPSSWVNDRPGYFTASGMPMRFMDLNGAFVDVYQATTQMTDESGQSYPAHPNALLDGALGANGYYAVLTVNAHTDAPTSPVADAVIASAQARGVPIVTSKQMLTWLDARNDATYSTPTWNGTSLAFTVTAGAGANGLRVLVPATASGGVLTSVTVNGTPQAVGVETIKGVSYAFVPVASGGAVVATYGADTTRPTVTATSPTSGATGVASTANVTATFSEAMDASTISGTTVELHQGTVSGPLVASVVSYDEVNRVVTVDPAASLQASTLYTARIRGGAADPRVKDLAGNALLTDFTWSFTTAAGPACPCTLWPSSAVPTNLAATVDPGPLVLGVRFRPDTDGFITGIRFYKGATNTGTHTGKLWTTAGVELGAVTFSGETSTGWQQATFASPIAVTANTTYIASYLAPNGNYPYDYDYFLVTGVDRAPLHAPASTGGAPNGVYVNSATHAFPTEVWRASNYWVDVVFTTTLGPDTTPPTVTATNPTSGATGVAVGANVTATFSEAMDASTISGTTVELHQGTVSGALVSAALSYDAPSRMVTINPNADLQTSTQYTARIRGGAADPRVKDAAGNALAADYTWSFTTAAPGDTTPPTVTGVSPANGATDVAVGSNATATFSEPMDATTVNGTTVELHQGSASGPLVSAAVSYDGPSRTVTVNPTADLQAGTQYTLRVRGGAADPRVKDVAGNALAADFTSSFTTAAAGGCPCTIWSSSAVPAVAAATNDPGPVVLGVRFRPDTNGFITGIRFYKGATNTGTHTGKLWTSAGAELGVVTFTGETSSGWQQATFASPIAVTANTTYIASYLAPNGNYAYDYDYFFASVDNAPLHAPASTFAEPNGVYLDGAAHGFPTSVWRASNYWVDVVFTTTGGGGDTTPPTVTGTVPTSGATGVAVSANATATFSEAMDASTINATTIELHQGTVSGALVAAALSYDAPSRTVTINPTADLQANTQYTARIRGGAADPRVKDAAGNALAADYTWSFTTAAVADTTPPTVTGTVPTSGATGVAVGANVTATFSEAMDASTINATTIELHQGTVSGALVAAALGYDAPSRTVTINPTTDLVANTQYTARIRGGAADPRVKDAAGNALAADYTWSFTTAPAVVPAFSLNFDGSNDRVQVSDSNSLDVGSLGTFELFAKPTTTPSSRSGLLAKSLWELNVIAPTSGSGFRFEFRTRTSTFNSFRTIVSGNLSLNQWYHVAATYDGTTQRLFVNGTQVASGSATGSLNNSSSLVMGAQTTSSTAPFAGRIDEVRISSTARYSSSFTPPTVAFTSDASTRGLWHLNEGTGTAAADSSPNANTGSLVGPTWNSDTAVP